MARARQLGPSLMQRRSQCLLLTLSLKCSRQNGGCPGSGSYRDPLIVPIRKSTLKVWLELWRAAADMPAAILIASPQQISYAVLVNILVGLDHARLIKRRQGLAGGKGVAFQIRIRRPAAIAALQSNERCGRRPNL